MERAIGLPVIIRPIASSSLSHQPLFPFIIMRYEILAKCLCYFYSARRASNPFLYLHVIPIGRCCLAHRTNLKFLQCWFENTGLTREHDSSATDTEHGHSRSTAVVVTYTCGGYISWYNTQLKLSI